MRGFTPQGTVRFARRELALTIKGGDMTHQGNCVVLNPLNLPFVKKLAAMFDRYTWHKCSLHYRPIVSATTNGAIILGVDWDSSTRTVLSYDLVAALTPMVETPVWQAASLVLPTSKLQTRKEYIIRGEDNKPDEVDVSPGVMICAPSGVASGTTVGHIWIEYDMSFFGTTI